jgi:hypothetical protein
MTVKERLKEFAKSKEKSVREFEIQSDIGIGYINAIRISISPDKIQSIVSRYPDLDIDWLFTGEGEMLKSEKEAPISYDTNNEIIRLISSIEKKDEQMDRLLSLLESQQRTIEDLAKKGNVEDAKGAAPKEAHV